MSPEVFIDKANKGLRMPYVSSANDVWALGVILINLLTTRNPWKEPSFQNAAFCSYVSPFPSTLGRTTVSAKVEAESSLKTQRTLREQFGFSKGLCHILSQVFKVDPFKRPSAKELGNKVSNLSVLFANDKQIIRGFAISSWSENLDFAINGIPKSLLFNTSGAADKYVTSKSEVVKASNRKTVSCRYLSKSENSYARFALVANPKLHRLRSNRAVFAY